MFYSAFYWLVALFVSYTVLRSESSSSLFVPLALPILQAFSLSEYGLLEQNESLFFTSKHFPSTSCLNFLSRRALGVEDSVANRFCLLSCSDPSNEPFLKKRPGEFCLRSSGNYSPSQSSNGSKIQKLRKLYECISDEVQVNSETDGSQVCPFVLNLKDSSLVLLWYSDTPSAKIKGQVVDINLDLTDSEFEVSSDLNPPGDNTSKAAVLENGVYVVVWRTVSEDVYGRIMNKDQGEGTEFLVNTITDGSQLKPDVISLSSGGFLVVWVRDYDNINHSIIGKIFDRSGDVEQDEFEVYSASSTMWWSRAAPLNDGGFVVIWLIDEEDGSGYRIHGQVFDSSFTPTGNKFLVNTNIASSQQFPSIATLSDGRFVVSWDSPDQDGSENGVYAQILDSSASKIGNEFLVNTETANSQRRSNVISLHDGGFLISWASYLQDGEDWGIFFQRYDESGNTFESETQVNVEVQNSQSCVNSEGIFYGFVVSWQSDLQDGDSTGIYSRAFFDSNVVSDTTSCLSCNSNQYVDGNVCEDCRTECESCLGGVDCNSCDDSTASTPGCCIENRLFTGSTCTDRINNQYFTGTECESCEDGCATCDAIGCVTCLFSGVDCCSPYRVLLSDNVSCGCSSECATCDEEGCLTCSSGQSCCPSSRFFLSGTCEDCETSDSIGCLTCPSGDTTCCPEGRFYSSNTDNCEECVSPCMTCTSESDCLSCLSGENCCGEGTYQSGTSCETCLSDCATCSDGLSCDICRDSDVLPSECCPDSTQDDANADGFCECSNGNTAVSDCSCLPTEAYFFTGSQYLCLPVDIMTLTTSGPSEVGSSCSEDVEIFVTDFSGYPNNAFNTIKFRWFSDQSSLSSILRSETSNPLLISSSVLPEGTTTFTVYLSLYGAVYEGTHTITKSVIDSGIAYSISPGSVISLSTEESVTVTVSVSSSPCSDVTYSWYNTDSVRRLQLPSSSSESLEIPANSLPVGSHIYTVSITSGSTTSTDYVVFVVSESTLVAVIDDVGPYIASTESLTLDGSNSYDSTNASGSLTYSWTCTSSNNCPSIPDSSVSVLSIPSSELADVIEFTMILTIIKDTRADSSSVFLSVNPCGSSSVQVINPAQDYAVSLVQNPSQTITSLFFVNSNLVNGRVLQSTTISGNVISAGTIISGLCYVYEATFQGGSETVAIYGNKGPACEDSSGILPFVVNSGIVGSIEIANCEDQDEFGSDLVYTLTVMNPSLEITTELDQSSSNIVVFDFDISGEYEFTGIVCDSIGSCAIYQKVYTSSSLLSEKAKRSYKNTGMLFRVLGVFDSSDALGVLVLIGVFGCLGAITLRKLKLEWRDEVRRQLDS